MSSSKTPATRARDTDRIDACARLDAAYAEGQLGAAEYFDRTEQARTATTVVELASLIGDLRNCTSCAREISPRDLSTKSALRFAGRCGGGGRDCTGCSPTRSARAAGRGGRTVHSKHRACRFSVYSHRHRRRLRVVRRDVRFRDGAGCDLYPDRAVVGRVDGSGNFRNFDFRGTLTPSDEPASVAGNTDMDLTNVNRDALVSVIAQSPAALAGTRVDHITLADSGAPVISIYVVDDTGAYTGVRKMTFDGRVF